MYREEEVIPVAANQYGFLTRPITPNMPKALVTAGKESLILGIRDKEAGIGVLANLNRPDLNDTSSIAFRGHVVEHFLTNNAAVLSMDIYNHDVPEKPSYPFFSRRQFVENLRFYLEEHGLVVIPYHNPAALVACFFDIEHGILSTTQSERIGFKNRKLMRNSKRLDQEEPRLPITEVKVS